MESEWLIELEEVDVTPPDETALVLARSVQWRIARGDFWIVGGAPSAGKTSLLSTAAGLNRPATGVLRVFGRSLAEATETEQVQWRQRIGFVFERGGRLFPHLTLAQNVALALEYHTDLPEEQIAQQVEEWLARVELSDQADALPARVNPIWQQRVGLARALILPKEVLFVDSPPMGRTRDALWWRAQLAALNSEGVTVVVGTNDFSLWLDTAKQFALVQDGQFLILGGPQQVRACLEAPWRDYIMVD